MKTKTITLATSLALASASLATPASAATEADVEATFFPYKNGFPSIPALTAGTVINKGNVEQFKEVIPTGVSKFLKDGLFELKVGPTANIDIMKPYIDATRKNLNKAKLGAKNGDIEGYVAGRPFPEDPDLKDPRAGEKLAWNYKYGVNWGDNASINPFFWKYRNMTTGQIERTIKFEFHFLNFKHRVKDAPVPEVTPNPANLFRGIYVKVNEPQDLKNTQLLIQRFEDDQRLDDAYLYLGFQRRVRRLATGQTTDSFLGSDLMIEDFEGYNGRISDMLWTYKGTKTVLLPFWDHNEQKLANDMPPEPDGYKYIGFSGQVNCFPDETWQ